MKNAIAIIVLALFFKPASSIECYECNTYGDDEEYECIIQTCPTGYNLCTVKTFTPSADSQEGESPDCYHEHDNGTSYRGYWNKTIDNSVCHRWDANFNFSYNPWKYPDLGLADNNNCRNPDGDMRPWCYTTLLSNYAYCSVPRCQTHITTVTERRCGWLNKNFCKDETHGQECYSACETSLCNRPSGKGKILYAGAVSSATRPAAPILAVYATVASMCLRLLL